jgi:hypothetical protein
MTKSPLYAPFDDTLSPVIQRPPLGMIQVLSVLGHRKRNAGKL